MDRAWNCRELSPLFTVVSSKLGLVAMNDVTEVRPAVAPTILPALTPESLSNLLKITAPTGSVTVKGIASEVHYWKKPGETRASKIYEAFRTIHEVILVGDMVGNWSQSDASQTGGQVKGALAPLVRQQPRMTVEAAVAKHGLGAMAFLATGTAWQGLTNTAADTPEIGNCKHVETNFMQPSRFIEGLLEVCRDPAIKVLVVTRGGGGGLAAIGDSHKVAAALLSSGRVFYTALGHDKDVLLLDKYADQAFATPSALGQSLAKPSAWLLSGRP